MSTPSLLVGDCRKLLATWPEKAIAATLMDPPYDGHTHARGSASGAVRRSDGGPAINSIDFEPLDPADIPILAGHLARITQRWIVTFCAYRHMEAWCSAMEGLGWHPRLCVWIKPDGSPQFSGDRPGQAFELIVAAHAPGKPHWNGGGHRGVYVCNRIDRESGFWHPTQKPVKLMRDLVRHFTDPGETVLDPYAGSGTTLVAAAQLGRASIGMELDPDTAADALKRIGRQGAQIEMWRKPKQQQLGGL